MKMNKIIRNIAVIVTVLFLGFLMVAVSENYTMSFIDSDDDCYACHEDKDLTAEVDGKKVSLFVDKKKIEASAHAGVECRDCHVNYSPDEVPHTKTKTSVNCQTCHDDLKGIQQSVHGKVECSSCHKSHEIKTVKQMKEAGSEECLQCHKTKGILQFVNSIHDKKDIDCDDCHKSGHGVVNINKSTEQAICGKCHSKNKMALSNSIHNTALGQGNTKGPSCTDCHGSHAVLTSKITIESEGCLKCHLNEKLFPGEDRGSAKFVAQYRTSVHASITKNDVEAAGCVDCHGDHMVQNADNPQASTVRARQMETCGKCHSDIVGKFRRSKHGQELANGNKNAPTCTDCHGEHDIKTTFSANEFSKLNLVDKCLDCHKDGKINHKTYLGEEELISGYKESQHYKALQEGNLNAPTCSNCHGAHEMESAVNVDSKISKRNLEKTCGQAGCHTQELKDYIGSVHEVAITKDGNKDSPSCNDCHGNHVISKKDIDDKLEKSKGVIKLCSNCHASLEIIERNDLPTKVAESYKESFHGLATRGGLQQAANCESCHGNHNIRPSSDSLSTINKINLPATCGSCHPGANEAFFSTKIHIEDARKDSPIVYIVTVFYMALIIGLIGFMLLHNILDYRRKTQLRKAHGS
jgi:predicted CXXCH cytochrome family protein